MLTYRQGDPERPRGHALLFFHDSDNRDTVWATYLIVLPINLDIAKYLPAAFAGQVASQMAVSGPAAYPLPPIPEHIDGGVERLETMAHLRGDDLLDGGTIRASDPLQAIHPVQEIGLEYATRVASYLDAAPELSTAPTTQLTSSDAFNVDDILLQVLPDNEKVAHLARQMGNLRYALEGGDETLAAQTVDDMERTARHMSEKYRISALIAAARSTAPNAGQLAQLYVDRAYKMADEEYDTISDLDRQIEALGGS